MNKPEIRSYSDYRSFLKDYVDFRHAKQPTWSYATWGRKLGLSSPSTLIMIVNGQRHPGSKVLQSLIKYFKFSSEDEQYFLNLVRIQKKVTDPRLSVVLIKHLLADAPGQNAAETENAVIEDVLFNRNTYVLREMTELKDFSEDAEWIQKRLIQKLSAKEISALIKNLMKFGLIERSADGKLKSKAASRAATPPPKEKIYRLHDELVSAAKGVIEHIPEEKRAFHTTFLNIRADKITEAKDLLNDFQKKFSELMEVHPGDEVYQLNLHFFPVTQGLAVADEIVKSPK